MRVISKKSLICVAVFTAFPALTATACDALKGLEFSGAVGSSWTSANNSQMVVTPYETDSLRTTYVTKQPVWRVGVGYSLLQNQLSNRQFLNKFLVELNLYQSYGAIKGDVWQYQSPNFNNYSYTVPIRSTRLMLDVKPSLFTWHDVSPYPIVGVGAAWNRASYYDVVTNPDMDASGAQSLAGRTHTSLAYDLGAGVQTAITKNVSASLEYLYTKIGTVSPGAPNNDVPNLKSPQFSLHSQNVLLGLTWKIS